jgi:hypothetical protein
MKRLFIACAFLLIVSTTAFSQTRDLGPGEPEIVLPQLVLQVEDLSVEKIEAKLPPDAELLPPERGIPLRSEGEVPVGEPAVIPDAPSDAGQENPNVQGLTSQAALGAGIENSIIGSLTMKTLGSDPRLSLSFSHLTIDGFNGRPAGSGFDVRSDDISGEIAMKLGLVDLDMQGGFKDDAAGLQGQGAGGYIDRLTRDATGSLGLSINPIEWLTIKAGFSGGYDTLTLSRAAPLGISELRVSPDLSVEIRIPSFKAALGSRYEYRTAGFGSSGAQEIHRVLTGLSLGLELPASMLVEGSVAWSWKSGGVNLFPFELRISGTPFSFLSFGIGGGYSVVPYDISDIMTAYPIILPQPFVDSEDHGWFGDVSVQLSPFKDINMSGKLSFMTSAAMLDSLGYPDLVQDAQTGLFLLTQRPATRLTSEIGLRWTPIPGASLGGSWKLEIMDRPAFVPQSDIKVDGLLMEQSGAFGGNVSVEMRAGTTTAGQWPIVNVGGFFKISDAVLIYLDVEDLLQPGMGAHRLGVGPFEEPGFRVIAEARLSF